MSESYPSKEVCVANFPDPSSIVANFVYNFFTKDEKINDSGVTAAYGEITESRQALIDNKTMEKTVPRYIRIDWPTIRVNHERYEDEARSGLVQQYRHRIQSEDEIAIPFQKRMIIQDTGLKHRLRNLLDEFMRDRVEDSTLEATASQTDIAEAINMLTPDEVQGEQILELLLDREEQGIAFVNEVGEKIVTDTLAGQTNFRFTLKSDERFLGDISRQMYANPLCPSGVTQGINIDESVRRQGSARQNTNSEINIDIDYEPNLRIFQWRLEGAPSLPQVGAVGYVIDKYEMLPDGTRGQHTSLYMNGSHVSSVIDSKIKYGMTYAYTVSAVFIVEITSPGPWGLTWKARALVKSRPSPQVVVQCVEHVPPPEPDGIFYYYMPESSGLNINWQFPVSSQRDVKKFQVFRRRNIEEPFTIIAQFDFDDSVIKSHTNETVDESINHILPGSRTYFIDSDFDRDGDFIYTVCSIDAHGLTSNYGAQTRVYFDKLSNSLKLKSMSRPGAPKQYPNMFVSPTESANITTNRITEDVMKDSGHQSMRIYLDPEYLTVRGEHGEDLKLLATDRDRGLYKFQIINVDRQKARTVTINLRDRQTARRVQQ